MERKDKNVKIYVILLDIAKSPSIKVISFFNFISKKLRIPISLQTHQQSMLPTSSVFDNLIINGIWYLCVVLIYVSHMNDVECVFI